MSLNVVHDLPRSCKDFSVLAVTTIHSHPNSAELPAHLFGQLGVGCASRPCLPESRKPPAEERESNHEGDHVAEVMAKYLRQQGDDMRTVADDQNALDGEARELP